MALLPPPLALNTARSRTQVILAVILPVLGTLTLIARYASRRIKRVRLGLDDYIMIPALFAVYAQCIIVIFSAYYGGVGLHIIDVGPENLITLFKLLAAVQFSFATSLGLAKVSLCLLLIRIFPSKRFQIAAYIVLAYCVCWILMVYSIAAGICRPFAYNWDKTIPNGHCGNLDGAYISIAVFDILGDLAIIALPMHQVWHLHTRTATKIGLSILFALGALNVIVAIIRIIYLTDISFAPNSDFTWDAAKAYAWSVTEPNLGFIVANAVVTSPAVERGVVYLANHWNRLASISIIERIRSSFSEEIGTLRSTSTRTDNKSDEMELSPYEVRQTVAIDIRSNPK